MAAVFFSARMLHWGFAGDHVAHPRQLGFLVIVVSGATTMAALAWIIYIACEPYVRRLWPQTMVGWTRALSGRFKDPLVGRDISWVARPPWWRVWSCFRLSGTACIQERWRFFRSASRRCCAVAVT